MLRNLLLFLFLIPSVQAIAVTPYELNNSINTFFVINNNEFDALYTIDTKTLEVGPKQALIPKGDFKEFKIKNGKTETFTVEEKIGNTINAVQLTYTKKTNLLPIIIFGIIAIIFIKRTLLKETAWSILRRLRKNGKSDG